MPVKFLKRLALGLALCASASLPPNALAWSGHTLLTWQALSGMPEVTQAKVKVESIDAFLAAEGANLERLLQEQEQWARTHIPNYPPRPDALAFKAKPDAAGSAGARLRFLEALRLNPQSKLALFIEVQPGQATPGSTREW